MLECICQKAEVSDQRSEVRSRPSEMRCARHGHEFHGVKKTEDGDRRLRFFPHTTLHSVIRASYWMIIVLSIISQVSYNFFE